MPAWPARQAVVGQYHGAADGRCGVDRGRKVRRIRSVPRTERADLIEQVIADQSAVLQRLRSVRPLPEWAGLSLTLGQLTALFVLYRRGAMAIGELGAVLGLGKPASTVLVNALVGRHLVERQEDARDRRISYAGVRKRARLWA